MVKIKADQHHTGSWGILFPLTSGTIVGEASRRVYSDEPRGLLRAGKN